MIREAARVAKTDIDTNFVTHHIRVMKAKLRKITLTLDEHVARWVRLEAARKKTSISRLLEGILRENMLEKEAYEAAMHRALAREPFLYTKGRHLSRGDRLL